MQKQEGVTNGEGSSSVTHQPTRHNESHHQVHQVNVPMDHTMISVPAVPYGLQYLNGADHLIVSQKIEWLEVHTGFETENKYSILNNMGQKVYFAREISDGYDRMCWGNLRTFDMTVVDNQNCEVLRFHRPFARGLCSCSCESCLQSIDIMSPSGEVYGFVKQVWTFCTPLFDIFNAHGDPVLRVKGQKIQCFTPSFRIYTQDGQCEIGKIKKNWAGFFQELVTDADNFAISFPIDLDVRMKAVLLGTLFLIDFMYFEESC